MKTRLALSIALVLSTLAVAGYLVYQRTLVPIPLMEGRELYAKASPEFGEDEARLEVLMPAGSRLEVLLVAQSDLTLVEKSSGGAWAGQLASGLQASRHGRRWRITVRTGWPLQARITSCFCSPALAAGPAAETARIRTPDSSGNP